MTARELCWAAVAADRQHWNHTSAVVAVIAEVNRNPAKRSKPFVASEFNPYEVKKVTNHRRQKMIERENFQAFTKLFAKAMADKPKG